jgi:tetratricopeptide (TPR) repeat protein
MQSHGRLFQERRLKHQVNLKRGIHMENLDEKKLEENEKIIDSILDGTFNAKDYYGLTDGGVEAMYATGYEFFQHKKYEQAQRVFSLLCFLDGRSKKFHYALGAVSFLLKQYLQAEMEYRIALLYGEYNPNLFLHLAEACLAQNKTKEATDCLGEVIRLSKLDEFKDDNTAKHAAGRAALMLGGLNSMAESKESTESAQPKK